MERGFSQQLAHRFMKLANYNRSYNLESAESVNNALRILSDSESHVRELLKLEATPPPLFREKSHAPAMRSTGSDSRHKNQAPPPTLPPGVLLYRKLARSIRPTARRPLPRGPANGANL
jgi:hypothetical protein